MEHRLATRAFWGFVGWGMPLIVVFFVTPGLLRALGVEQFGVLMIIFIAPLIAVHLDLGLVTVGMRRVALRLTQGKVDAGGTLASLTLALGAIGVLLSTALVVMSVQVSSALGFNSVLGAGESSTLLRACAAWIVINFLASVPALVARAAQALTWLAATQTLTTAALWLGALLLARGAQPLSYIVTLGLTLSAVSAIATLFAVRRRIDWSGPFRIKRELIVDDAHFAAGTFASQVAGTIVFHGDRVLVSLLGSPAMAGAYALCVNVANKTLAAIVAMTSFAFPHASGLTAPRDRRQFEELSQSLDRAVIVVIAPALALGVLLAEPFLRLWLGEFSSAELVTAFQILWVAFAIPAFAVPMSYLLAASGDANLAARFSILAAIVVLVTMAILIPPLGLAGAAFAMLLGMLVSPVFSLAVRRKLQLPHGSNRARFWLGVGCGLVVELALLVLLVATIDTWVELLLIGVGAWVAFYLTRGTLRLLSVEEMQLVHKLAKTIRNVRNSWKHS